MQDVPVRQRMGWGRANTGTGEKVSYPKWLMAAIAVLVVAAGVGTFALAQRAASPSPGMGSGATRAASSINLTQSASSGNSPAPATFPARTPTGATIALTCAAGGSHTASFTFAGAVAGTISLSTFVACFSATLACPMACFYASERGAHAYVGVARGKIGGATYQFEFLVNPYSGSGTYTSIGSTNVVLMQRNYEWESYGATGNRSTTVVGPNGKTGSIRATISMMSPQFDPASVVTVTGNWS